MPRIKTYLKTGEKFNRLTVIAFHHIKTYIKLNGNNDYRDYYLCKCDCGTLTIVDKNSLKTGNTKSCGCLDNQIKTKHGLFGTRIYNIWSRMKQRCNNKKNQQYKNYGGRGIKYCQEWNNFEKFYEWSKNNGYAENLTIDRIDVNGNYEPTNCRFITIKEQNRNKRNNVKIYYNGQEKCISEWAELFGIKKGLLYGRLKRGWTIERALNKL